MFRLFTAFISHSVYECFKHASISISEVHKKTGAEIVSNGIMGQNLGTKQKCRPQIQSHNTIGYELGTSLFMNFGNANCFDLLGPF